MNPVAILAPFFALAVVLMLVGCQDKAPTAEDLNNAAMVELQHKRRLANYELLAAFNSFESGYAAEVRMWRLDDGTYWQVIGRPDSYTVFMSPRKGDPWQVMYSPANRTTLPVAITTLIEKPKP